MISKNPSTDFTFACVADAPGVARSSTRRRLAPVQRCVPIKSPPRGFEMHESVMNWSTGGSRLRSSSVIEMGRSTRPPIFRRHAPASIWGGRVSMSTR
jgi:hypothetical protein